MGGLFFRWGPPFLSRGAPPGGGIDFNGGGVSKKIVGWGAHPHAPHPTPPNPGSEELMKCPPPSTAVQRFVNVVCERKPR